MTVISTMIRSDHVYQSMMMMMMIDIEVSQQGQGTDSDRVPQSLALRNCMVLVWSSHNTWETAKWWWWVLGEGKTIMWDGIGLSSIMVVVGTWGRENNYVGWDRVKQHNGGGGYLGKGKQLCGMGSG